MKKFLLVIISILLSFIVYVGGVVLTMEWQKWYHHERHRQNNLLASGIKKTKGKSKKR